MPDHHKLDLCYRNLRLLILVRFPLIILNPLLIQTPPAYLRNEKIIKNATVGAVSGGNQTVTITTEKPHKFFAGDKVKVQRIKSENNPTAVGININL
jgi:hypothetical protein